MAYTSLTAALGGQEVRRTNRAARRAHRAAVRRAMPPTVADVAESVAQGAGVPQQQRFRRQMNELRALQTEIIPTLMQQRSSLVSPVGATAAAIAGRPGQLDQVEQRLADAQAEAQRLQVKLRLPERKSPLAGLPSPGELRAQLSGDDTLADIALRGGDKGIAKAAQPDVQPTSALGSIADTARDVMAKGIVGQIDPGVARTGRELLYGSANPSAGQVALAAALTAGPEAVGRVVPTAVRLAQLARGGEAVAGAARGSEVVNNLLARGGVASEFAGEAARGVGAGARGAGAAAKGAAAAQAERAANLARTLRTPEGRAFLSRHGAAALLAKPSIKTAAAFPATVGAALGADVTGELMADPFKAVPTTLRAVPASLAYLATSAADIGQTGGLAAENLAATITGQKPPYSTSEVLGPVRGAGEEGLRALNALEPYISGDPEAVKRAAESETGYIVAPLVPKIAEFGWKGAKGVGRLGARKLGETETVQGIQSAMARRAAEGIAQRGVEARPGPIRTAMQTIGGHAVRKRIAVAMARGLGLERAHSSRAAMEVIKEARKIKKPKGASRDRIYGLISVLNEYGIRTPETALDRLQAVRKTLKPTGDNPAIVSTRDAIATAEAYPEVLADPHLWNAVDAYQQRARAVETSPRSTNLAQARVLSELTGEEILPPEYRVPHAAREFTDATTREEANADLARLNREIAEGKGRYRETLAQAVEAKRREGEVQVTSHPDSGVTVTQIPEAAPRAGGRVNDEVLADRTPLLWYPARRDSKAVNADDFAYGDRELFVGPKGWTHTELEHWLRDRGLLPKGVTAAPTRASIRDGQLTWQDRHGDAAGDLVEGQAHAEAAIKREYPGVNMGGHKPYSHAEALLAKGGKPKAAEAPRSQQLVSEAEAKRIALSRKVERHAQLRKALKRYSKGDKPPTSRQKGPWDQRLVDEFVNETREAAGREGFDEPAWVSEQVPKGSQSVGGRMVQAARAQQIKTGKAEVSDVADRSLRALVGKSIYAPRMRRAVDRFVRQFVRETGETVTVNGHERKFVTEAEWNELVKSGVMDPRDYVLLPSRQWAKSIEGEHFDIDAFRDEGTARLKEQVADVADAPGTKYSIHKRDAAKEFFDQIDPQGGMLEKVLSSAGLVGSRAILGFSPAWALAQVVAEGSQVVSSVGLPAAARAWRDLRKLKREDPEGYEAFTGWAGESAGLEQPHQMRLESDGGTMKSYNRAVEAIRRTKTGRALYDTATGRGLSMFDRWKSGKYRSIVLAARTNKELRGFTDGLQGALKLERKMSKDMEGMNRQQQLGYMARNPKLLQKHLDYLDDVMGNWQAFTRFEKAFAPALVFYPFLRMSLRWTFKTYPQRHPVKASMLYLLAQQNAEDLEKLLGQPPATFGGYAQPVIHGTKGETSGVLPGGARFGAPGSNVLVEAIGDRNLTAAARSLNPAVGIVANTLYGKTSFGQDTDLNPALNALGQLLSAPAPLRFAGLNRPGQGPPSETSQKLSELDPLRGLRSFAIPFIPQTAESAKATNEIIAAITREEGTGGQGFDWSGDESGAAGGDYSWDGSGSSTTSGGYTWQTSP